jgi:1-acyl-sn-glycerol-3-phosphate acyltransferase
MKSFQSALRWILGLSYFGIMFLVLILGIALFDARKIYPFVRVLCNGLLRVMGLKIKGYGYDRFDSSKSYLYLGNHESLFDIFAIPATFPSYLVGVEAASHFKYPVWGYLAGKWGNIPITRRHLPEALKTLEKTAEVLNTGANIIILPEGHRTLTGKMGSFKKGPFHLALAAKADILPFAFCGLYQFQNKLDWRVNPGTAEVKFGAPIAYETYKNDSIDTLRKRVRLAIMELKQEAKNQ